MNRRELLQGSGVLLGGWIVTQLGLIPLQGSRSWAQVDPASGSLPTPPPLPEAGSTPSPDGSTQQPGVVEFEAPEPVTPEELSPAAPVEPTPGSATPTPSAVPLTGVRLTWLYHSCVLFESSDLSVLVNPFRPIGCTAGYPAPSVAADLVLISSRLFDEGSLEVVPGNPKVLFQPGDYQIEGIRIQGVRMAHDNLTARGDRFGINVGWRWRQGEIDIVHLGGAAAPITREQSILLAKPDLLFIPVGGGPKNYDPPGAQAAIETLQPKIVIPTMYRTTAASETECDLVPLQQFLGLYPPAAIQRAPGRQVILSAQNLPPSGTAILVFDA